MGVVNREDLLAWQDTNRIICTNCGDSGEAEPLTKNDFDEGDIVACDECSERIL
jgi:DNA-directed RNA polymerase subunit RPC12/RpoP